MTEETRKCNKCGRVLPITEFYKISTRPNEKVRICKQCCRERTRLYAREHPDKVKESSARTREKHRDEIRQRNRDFYAKTKNDHAHIQARRDTYYRHKDRWHEDERKRRKCFNEKWKHPCEKCGEDRLYLIQFHHIDPSTKSFCIGALATSKSQEDLETEVKKCVCLCSNCHDEFHYFYGNKPKDPIKSLETYLNKHFKEGAK